jgi:hypothetical protein
VTSDPPATRGQWVLAGLILLATAACLVPGGILWGSVDEFIRWADHHGPLLGDFVLVWEKTGDIYRSEGVPGWRFFYTGFFGACLWFLVKTVGKLGLAWEAWLVGQFLAVLMLWAVVARDFALWRRALPLALWTALLLLAYPTLHNFRWGQMSTPLLALTLLALSMARAGGWWRRGGAAVLGLAAAIKAYPAIYALGILLRGGWRFVLLTAAVALFLIVVPPVAILGLERAINYHRLIAASVREAAAWVMLDPNSSYFANWMIWRFAYNPPWADAVRPWLALLGGAIAAGQMALCLVVRRRAPFAADYWCFVLISTALPFVVATSWPHYFVFLPVCLWFLAGELAQTTHTAAERRWLWGLFLLPAALMLTAPFRSVLPILWGVIEPATINMAYRTLGILMICNLLTMALSWLILLRQVEDGKG